MKKGRSLFGLHPNVTAAGLVSLFMDISSEMIYPLVPLFLANVLGLEKAAIGLIEGVAEATASFLKIFSGWLSDRLGNRKYLMAAGYAISVLSRPLLATATGWPRIMGARFIDRLGKGIRTAPRDAIIADSTSPERLGRAYGVHRAMDTVGAAIGPALAIFLLQAGHDYRRIFWYSAIPGLLAVLLIFLFIKEQRPTSARQSDPPRLTLRHFGWPVRGFILISALFALGNSSDAFLLLRAQQTGIPATLVPAVYLAFNLVYSLTAVPAGLAADRFGLKRVILLGFLLFAGVYYGFAVARTPHGIWLLFLSYGLFMGLTEGVQKAFLATIIPPEFKATAFGVHAAFVGLATLPASLIAGWLWDRVSPAAPFYFGAATAAMAALLFLGLSGAMRKAGMGMGNGARG